METIGKKIRELRTSKKITLVELASLTGLSQGFLSQVERSKSSITLQSLSKISEALEISRSYFFDEDDFENNESNKITSLSSNSNHHNTNFFYQSLVGDMDRPSFEPMLAILLSEETKPSPSSHVGQEFVYVLEGELTLILEDDEIKLSMGESFHIKSNSSHTWYNETNDVTKLLFVYSPIS